MKVHFDAYEQKKWSSNRYNLERMRVREATESLIRNVCDSLGDAADGISVELTQDHPTIFNNKKVDCQWAMMCRSGSELNQLLPLIQRERLAMGSPEDHTSPHTQAILCLRVDVAGVEISFRIHRNAHLDRKNLLARLSVDGELDRFLTLVASLPEDIFVAVDGDAAKQASLSTTEDVEAWVARFNGDGHWWTFGASYGRDDERLAQSNFAEYVADSIQALLPVYRYATWTPDNDYVDGATYLEKHLNDAAKSRTDVNAAEDGPETEPEKKHPKPSRPTTRGGSGGYRPSWTFKQPESDASAGANPVSPSSRMRARAQETAQRSTEWRYTGPVREKVEDSAPPRDPERRDRPRKPTRDNRTGQERDSGSGRPQRQDRSRRRHGHHNDGGGRGQGQRNRHQGRKNDDSRRTKGPRKSQNRPPKKPQTWASAEGAIGVLDYVRVEGGLLTGKVGKVVEITKRGHLKIDIGDMVFEVPQDTASKVVPE